MVFVNVRSQQASRSINWLRTERTSSGLLASVCLVCRRRRCHQSTAAEKIQPPSSSHPVSDTSTTFKRVFQNNLFKGLFPRWLWHVESVVNLILVKTRLTFGAMRSTISDISTTLEFLSPEPENRWEQILVIRLTAQKTIKITRDLWDSSCRFFCTVSCIILPSGHEVQQQDACSADVHAVTRPDVISVWPISVVYLY